MLLPERFLDFFRRHSRRTDVPMLVAISGGLDSVALCQLCQQAGFTIFLAHCNFGLRGDESDRDEAFVRQLAESAGLAVFVQRFDTMAYAAEQRLSVQEAARNLRYSWFRELMQTHGFACTLTAHHANDNIETLLINFFRGSGIEGMTGIREISSDGLFARPLLACTRAELEAYAHEHSLAWVEDSSNASTKYTRNFFRHELIPAIKQVHPEIEQNLLAHIERFKSIHELYRSSVKRILQSLCVEQGGEVRIPVRKLLKQYNHALVYELIRPYGFGEKQVEGVRQLLSAGSGKFIANGQWQIIRHRDWLIIAPCSADAETIVIEKGQEKAAFRNGWLQLQAVDLQGRTPGGTERTAVLDAGAIEYPLVLRPWKAGDYFYPLGMRKKKKLARFFIDRKLSKNQKESVWVLESGKKIIWVVGLRIDDRFRVTETTRSGTEITWHDYVVV